MKLIACFIPSFDFGGAQLTTINLANSLIKDGNIKVDIIVCKAEGGLLALLDKKVNVVDLKCSKVYKSIFKIRKYIIHNKPDYFISHSDIPNLISLIVKFSIIRYSPKFIIVQHNYYNIEIRSIKYVGKYIPFLIKHLYLKADFIVAVSEGVKNSLNKQLKEKKTIQCIYNPINIQTIMDDSQLAIESELGDNFLLYVGRLEKVKNLYFLLDVFKEFLKYTPNYKLVIIGDGELKSSLINYARSLYISDNVYFTGYRINPYNYIKRSSLILSTSFSEALPTIIVESMYFGKTVVSTPNKGAKELLNNGILGYLSSSFDNVDEFAQLIQEGLNTPIESMKLKEEFQNKFSSEKTVLKYNFI